jgi:hypothetical protein
LSPTQPVQAAFLSPHANQVAAFSRLGDKPPLPSSRRPSKPQDTAILPTDLSTQATRHRHPTDRYLYLLLLTQEEAPPTPQDSTLHPPCASDPNTVGLLFVLFRFIIESKIAERLQLGPTTLQGTGLIVLPPQRSAKTRVLFHRVRLSACSSLKTPLRVAFRLRLRHLSHDSRRLPTNQNRIPLQPVSRRFSCRSGVPANCRLPIRTC